MTHLQQLLADVLAAQAEAAAEDCGAGAWSAVTAAEYWQAVQSGLDDESEAYWEGYCQAEEERGREERRRQEEDPAGCWLDRLRELVGLPPRRR